MFSAVHPTTDIAKILRHVRFVPNRRLMQRSKRQRHSITSSARSSNDEGTLRPSAFAVLRLMVNWTLTRDFRGHGGQFSS
jgi:hypothetical protein